MGSRSVHTFCTPITLEEDDTPVVSQRLSHSKYVDMSWPGSWHKPKANRCIPAVFTDDPSGRLAWYWLSLSPTQPVIISVCWCQHQNWRVSAYFQVTVFLNTPDTWLHVGVESRYVHVCGGGSYRIPLYCLTVTSGQIHRAVAKTGEHEYYSQWYHHDHVRNKNCPPPPRLDWD